MASRRMIHSKIWDSDQFNRITVPERLLYVALISLGDDEGCFRADAKYWKRLVFYSDSISANKVRLMLDHIQEAGLIVCGDTKKGKTGFHPNWHHYQALRSDRSKPSDFIEILVANGRTPRFTDAAQDRLGEINTSQIKDRTNELSVSEATSNLSPSPREKMLGAWNGSRALSKKMGINEIKPDDLHF